MISQGHVFASRYPLCKVWSEAKIARRRLYAEETFRMGNDKLVQVSVHGGKKGQSLFAATIKEYANGGST